MSSTDEVDGIASSEDICSCSATEAIDAYSFAVWVKLFSLVIFHRLNPNVDVLSTTDLSKTDSSSTVQQSTAGVKHDEQG